MVEWHNESAVVQLVEVIVLCDEVDGEVSMS